MRRLRKTGKSCGSLSSPQELPENVIDLASFRRERLEDESRTIYYLTTEGLWRDPINSFPFLNIIEISSNESLARALMAHPPDLILLEGQVAWLDPIRFISEAQSAFEIPLVMIYEGENSENSTLLKQAYAAGLHDVLFTPLKREDLIEMFEVLLTLRLQSSSHH